MRDVQTGWLRVRLVDPEGHEVPRLVVSLRDARTGRFAPGLRLVRLVAGEPLLGVPPGRYRLTAEAEPGEGPGGSPGPVLGPSPTSMLLPTQSAAIVTVHCGEGTLVELRAQRGGRLRLRLDAPAGENAGPARLDWAPGEAGAFRPLRVVRPATHGWSVQAELPPGVACLGYDLLLPGCLVVRASLCGSAPILMPAAVEAGLVRDVVLSPRAVQTGAA